MEETTTTAKVDAEARMVELEEKLKIAELELKLLKETKEPITTTKSDEELLLEELGEVDGQIQMKQLELNELIVRKEQILKKLNLVTKNSKSSNMVTLDVAKIQIRSGWLWMKNSGTSYFSFASPEWQKRYLVFDMYQIVNIFYFSKQMPEVSPQRETESDEVYRKRKKAFFEAQKLTATGYIRLLYASIEIPTEKRTLSNRNINPNFEFDIIIPNSKPIHLCANNQEEFNMWVQSIQYITSSINNAREAAKKEKADSENKSS